MDKWITIALNADPKELQAPGKYNCKYVAPDIQGVDLIAGGNTIDVASTKLGLLCIQHACSTLGQKVGEALQRLLSTNPEEVFWQPF